MTLINQLLLRKKKGTKLYDSKRQISIIVFKLLHFNSEQMRQMILFTHMNFIPIGRHSEQWRIQDFPDGWGEDKSLIFDKILAKNSMKVREILQGGHVPAPTPWIR